MFGPAQSAVAKAVADSVAKGVIPRDQAEDLVCVCGVFIHPEASDNQRIYNFNYEATEQAIRSAMQGRPTVEEMLAGKEKAKHPFRGFDDSPSETPSPATSDSSPLDLPPGAEEQLAPAANQQITEGPAGSEDEIEQTAAAEAEKVAQATSA